MCEFCGGSVTHKEWFVKDEQGKIDETHSAFLNVCESCGHGSEHETEILRTMQGLAMG